MKMSISKFALVSDSMGSKLTLPNIQVFAYSGARPNDRRVIECINSMRYGDYGDYSVLGRQQFETME